MIYHVPRWQDYLDSGYASLFQKSTAQLICLLQGPFITFNICFDERFDLTTNKAKKGWYRIIVSHWQRLLKILIAFIFGETMRRWMLSISIIIGGNINP